MSAPHARGKEIFLELCELEPPAQRARLAELCGDDARLRAEVEGLLAAHAEPGEFLEHPPLAAQARRPFERPPATGDEIGPYRLREVLGEGGMGVVFLAEQREPLRRDVALKVLKPGLDAARLIARFEAERRALALMNHPAIARALDAGSTAGGFPYFVMEHVEGEPLVEYCDRRRLGLERRIELFLEVCDAVGHAHQKGILHRDLKPTNLLVGEQSGRAAPKVIDFGVAKALDEPFQLAEGLTLVGTVIGTPEYMSPEQADQSERAVDTRSDIYSLGVVLYELLTGTLPIDVRAAAADGLTAVRARILHDPPRPASRSVGPAAAAARGLSPEALARALRGDLEWILARALAKDPDERYAAVSELAADLRRHLAREPVLAGPPTGVYRLRKYVARHRVGVAASAVVLLALVGGLGLSLWSLLKVREAEQGLLRLSDQELLEQYLARAETLPFAAPSDAGELARLEDELLEVQGHLPLLRGLLDRLRARADEHRADADGTRAWVFGSTEETWHHKRLSELVAALDELSSPDLARSGLARLRQRRHWAEESARATVERSRDEWEQACRTIADESLCPEYHGLQLDPQIGLVPLGRNEVSGLYEFWHPTSGERPRPDGQDGWIVAEETGLVFVLIPAGSFRMGARRPQFGDDPFTPNVDPQCTSDERPVHDVRIGAPFFLSKYEMTQGQWLRMTWHNPSQNREAREQAVLTCDLRHPVEWVQRGEALSLLERMGMTLPTEAQWEYAARAGTASPFACGPEPECLEQCANILDQAVRATSLEGLLGPGSAPWFDGHATTAPVGSYAANLFGLHDVHGNVWEMVRDTYVSYDRPTDPLDGLRSAPDVPVQVVARGGSFVGGPVAARVSSRNSASAESVSPELGLRPARRIDSPAPSR